MESNGHGVDPRDPVQVQALEESDRLLRSAPSTRGLSELLFNSGQTGVDQFLNRLNSITANAIYSQRAWLRQVLTSQRDLNKECHYPDLGQYTAWDYHRLYRQEAIANRVVGVMPSETWKISPQVYEEEDGDKATPFEQSWDDVARNLRGGSYYQDEEGNPIWEVLERLDRISGIGQYGVLLLGLDDANDDGTMRDLSLPVSGVEEQNSVPGEKPVKKGQDGKGGGNGKTKVSPTGNEGASEPSAPSSPSPQPRPSYRRYSLTVNAEKVRERRLLYLRPFPESLAQITAWETNPSSPRYGLPVKYLISFNDPTDNYTGVGPPLTTQEVHWTRCIHVAEGIESNEVYAVPRMQPVLRRLLDLQKNYGGAAEGFWQGCIPGIKIESNPQLGANVRIPRAETKDAMEDYLNGFQRFLIGEGTQINTLAPQIVDPTAQINIQIQAICICIEVPQRIFMGSERGELSSSQDSREWTGRVKKRQSRYITPRMIVPLVDRLILVGVLEPPEDGYSVFWPDMAALTDAEKAQIATQRVQALTAFISGGGEAGMTWHDFWTKFMQLTDEEASAIIEAVASQAHGDEGTATGRSPLLSTVGGANALVALYGAAAQGAMSEDQLRGAFKVLFQLSDNDLDALIADSSPASLQAEQAALQPPPGEEGGQPPEEDGAQPEETPPQEVPEVQPEDEETPAENAKKQALTGGRWVTTDGGHHIYIRDGDIVAGNPHVLKAVQEKGGHPEAPGKKAVHARPMEKGDTVHYQGQEHKVLDPAGMETGGYARIKSKDGKKLDVHQAELTRPGDPLPNEFEVRRAAGGERKEEKPHVKEEKKAEHKEPSPVKEAKSSSVSHPTATAKAREVGFDLSRTGVPESERFPKISSDPPPGRDYEYHSTHPGKLEAIAAHGIGDPRGQGQVSLAPHQESAQFWADALSGGGDSYMMRVSRKDLSSIKTGRLIKPPAEDGSRIPDTDPGREHWFAGANIPPEKLEVYWKGEWYKLHDLVKPAGGGPTGNLDPTLSQEALWDYERGAPLTNASALTGGRWVTTEGGHHLYLKGGQIVAGNREVVDRIVDSVKGRVDQ